MTDPRRLKEEATAAAALLANIRDVVGDDEELALTTIEGETNLVELVRRAIQRVQDLEDHGEAIGERQKTLKERKERLDNQAERIRLSVLAALEQVELARLELPEATLTVKDVAPKTIVTVEADVPAKYWKPQPPKLDMKAISEAIKAGENVAGATLSNKSRTLQIRNK